MVNTAAGTIDHGRDLSSGPGTTPRAPVTVLAAQATCGALSPLRRAHPYLEVITPDTLSLTEPGTTRRGWTRR